MNTENEVNRYKEAIDIAKRAVEGEDEFKKEAFLEILQSKLALAQPLVHQGVGRSVVELTKPTTKPITDSPAAFIREMKVGNNFNNITLSLAYFILKREGKEMFNSKELNDLYQKARQKKPRNISDTIAANIRKGLITEQEGEGKGKKYTISMNGEDYLENGFKEPKR